MKSAVLSAVLDKREAPIPAKISTRFGLLWVTTGIGLFVSTCGGTIGLPSETGHAQ